MKKNNVVKLHTNKRPQRVRTKKKKTLEVLHRPLVRSFFFMDDEQPSVKIGKASDVYQDYVFNCLAEGLNYCSQCIFGKIAKTYVTKSQGSDGCVYYSLKPSVYNRLLGGLEGGEVVKRAA